MRAGRAARGTLTPDPACAQILKPAEKKQKFVYSSGAGGSAQGHQAPTPPRGQGSGGQSAGWTQQQQSLI